MALTFGSVCSGIEAASVAWEPLGWIPAWFSEIEPFPCELLDQRFPWAMNYGDMTTLPERIRAREIEAPDLLCGGTPCQAFSVAGKRQSLADNRGNLTLIFCEIANAIEDVRNEDELPPPSSFGKTSPESSTLRTTPSAVSWENYVALSFPLKYQAANGRAQVSLPAPRGVSHGARSTLNFSESPNVAKESSLSQVLVTGSIPQRYFLSARACAGILARAQKRGKLLPPSLKAALERSAKQTTKPEPSRQAAE
jgi:hypothetical protein